MTPDDPSACPADPPCVGHASGRLPPDDPCGAPHVERWVVGRCTAPRGHTGAHTDGETAWADEGETPEIHQLLTQAVDRVRRAEQDRDEARREHRGLLAHMEAVAREIGAGMLHASDLASLTVLVEQVLSAAGLPAAGDDPLEYRLGRLVERLGRPAVPPQSQQADALPILDLPPGWSALDRPLARTTVLLHEDGAWTEIDSDALRGITREAAASLSSALVGVRQPGRHQIMSGRADGVTWTRFERPVAWSEGERADARPTVTLASVCAMLGLGLTCSARALLEEIERLKALDTGRSS